MRTIRKYACAAVALLVFAPLGIANAQVTVTAADPSAAPQGTLSLDVTITGNGFDSTAQVDFLVTGTTNPGGITVRKVSVKGSKRLVATIDIADTAVVDKFDIEVRLSNGRKGKGTTLFTVQQKTNDPCAAGSLNWQGFPAYAYFTNIPGAGSADPYQVRVASANGQCSLRVMTLPDNVLTMSFAETATPGLYRLIVGKYLFLHLAEFRVGTDPASDMPRLESINIVSNFRETGSQLGFAGADLSPDGERVAIVRYFGHERRLTIADFDDSTPDFDVCARTGLTEYLEDWGDVAWAPSGRVSFLQSSATYRRIVGIDVDAPPLSPADCDPQLVVSFWEGDPGAVPLGEPLLMHYQSAVEYMGVEYLSMYVTYSEKVRKGTQTSCGVWVWNASTVPATRVLDRTNGAPRGRSGSFTAEGSLLYQPGCELSDQISEFGFLGAPTSIQSTAEGRWAVGLKKRTVQ
jgi:hypothetical protein